MAETVLGLGAWSWFLLGGLLLGAEIVVPGASLIWLGLAAFAAGAIGLLLGPAWQIQILLFALLSLAAVMAGRWLAARGGAGSDRPFLNRRIDALVGRTFILEGAIHDGTGTVRVDDSLWRVHGPDLPAGTRVTVIRSDGAVLFVERTR
ncbi:NfeD family protein [Aquabacter spiritensis]|uniref:NfeD-like C-terminal domain-containing protein n=1 Tax=Aquabacter spiritensis TaxID=933073 RepID=A0A4R3M1H7_9HYPH|nr:NfeD family protein [Aquabacter spiritensis]TCT06029.1 hypothetical protein EDC64_103132 [Aquabacter spiritensis]